MQIVENRALLFVTRKADQIKALIPKSHILERNGALAKILVNWGPDEVQILRNLKIKAPPHPILGTYDWPGVYTPFEHQRTTAAFFATHPRCFCFNEPGTGKTSAAAWAADYLMNKGRVKRVLVICPVSIMDTAWRADLFRTVMHRTVAIATGDRRKREAVIAGNYEVVIINFDGVKVVTPALAAGEFDLIIADECFVAGTLVATPRGRKPIEQLEAGDKILSSDGVMRIKRLVRNTATTLVDVKLYGGKTIRCTPDHPFFTDIGWVCARNLAGRRLISGVEMSSLRAGLPATAGPYAMELGEGPPDWNSLFSILRTEESVFTESQQQLLQANVARASRQAFGSEISGTQSKIVRDSQSQRPQAANPQGQRYGDDFSRTTDFRGFTCGGGMELPGSVGEEAARLSYELQTRFCMAASQNWVGSGWEQPPLSGTENSRSQERSKIGAAWVESVSYIKYSSGIDVFNLEAEGTPNYFVGDHWLVHNCNAVKSVSTDRWKALASLVRADTRLWMMTGTPASQSPLDAYGLAKLVNPDNVPRFFGAWRDKVMIKINQYKWVPRNDSQTIVHDALQPAIRFTKEECLDLPDLLYATREVPITPQQQKYYNAIKQEMITRAAGEEITAANAAGMLNKLLQISCGCAYTDTKEVIQFDIKNRLAELVSIIEQTDRKVLVFVPFRHVIDMLRDELTAFTVETIHGGVAAGARADIIKRFQTQDSPQVLLLVPQATAHGITLTRADQVVWWGPVSSTEMYLQANARAHRQGQTRNVTVTHLQGSPVEKRMYAMLQNKIDLHQSLVDLYKQEIS